MSRAYLYGRVSTLAQEISLAVQEKQARAYFEYKLAPLGVELIGPFAADAAVSGGTNFRERPSGARLNLCLERGDHLVITKLDRAFRDIADWANTVKAYKERGVTVHFLDAGIDTGTIAGELMVGMLALFAQFERNRMSERMKENKRERLARGLPVQGTPPIGKRIAGVKGHRYFVDDEYDLACMERIYVLYNAGHSFDEIRIKFLINKVRTRRDHAWSEYRVKKAYAVFCKRLHTGESQPPPEVADLPLPPLPKRATSQSCTTPPIDSLTNLSSPTP